MEDNEIKGIPSWGRVLLETEDGPKEIIGIVRRFEGLSPEQVMEKTKKGAKPYFDYFVFSSPPADPANPQTAKVYSVSVDAKEFSADGKPYKATLLKTNEAGTLVILPGAKLFREPIDNSMRRIKKIDVQFDPSFVGALTKMDETTRKTFAERLEDKIGGENLGLTDIRTAVAEVAQDMRELVWTRENTSEETDMEILTPWGVSELNIETIDDPDGGKGAKAAKVSVKIFPAPDQLSLGQDPVEIQEKAIKWLGKKMQKIFEDSPLVSCRATGVDAPVTGSDSSQTRPGNQPLKLILNRGENGGVSWHFPPNVPIAGSPIGDTSCEIKAWKALDRVTATKPGAAMRIPADVFAELQQKMTEWRSELMSKTPGIYIPNMETRSFELHLRPEIVITDEDIAKFKALKIDLGKEQVIAAEESKTFSQNNLIEFVSKIAKKFEDAGYELFDVKWEPQPDGKNRMNLDSYKKLIHPDHVEITGDVDLPDLGGFGAIKKALGTSPMTRAEFRKRLLDIEELYHRAGYLIQGENPISPQGVQITDKIDMEGDSAEINIKVARAGKISISGKDVCKFNKKRIVKSLKIKEGEPLKFDFTKHSLITAERTHLAIDSDSSAFFVIRPDGKTDVIINARGKQNAAQAGVGSDGRSIDGNAAVALNNKIPGITRIQAAGTFAGFGPGHAGDTASKIIGLAASAILYPITGAVSPNILGSFRIYVDSVPLNEDGIYLSGGMGASNLPYEIWDENGQNFERGFARTEDGLFEVHIPLGNEGIASSWMLTLGVNGSRVRREGELAQSKGNTEVDKTTYYHGERAAVSYMDAGLAAERDMLQAVIAVDVNHNATDAKGDTTVSGGQKYIMPLRENLTPEQKAAKDNQNAGFFTTLRENLTLEQKTAAGKRFPIYGGNLPFERAFMPGSIPMEDFGRSWGDPYSRSYYLFAGVNVMYTQNPFFQPGIGATVSSGTNGGFAAGTGFIFRVPIIGLSAYIGLDKNRRATWGLGVSLLNWQREVI